jgi:hypothetical protein
VFLCDLAERVARFDRVGRRGRLGVGVDGDLGHDVVAPVGYGLDGVPNLVDLVLVLDLALEVKLAVAFLGSALHAETLGGQDGVAIFVS